MAAKVDLAAGLQAPASQRHSPVLARLCFLSSAPRLQCYNDSRWQHTPGCGNLPWEGHSWHSESLPRASGTQPFWRLQEPVWHPVNSSFTDCGPRGGPRGQTNQLPPSNPRNADTRSCVRPTRKPRTYTMLLWLVLCLCFPPGKLTMHCLVQFLFPTGLQNIAKFMRFTYSFSLQLSRFAFATSFTCITFCKVCLSLCRTSLGEPVSACEKAQQCTPPPREQFHYHTQANPKQTASNQII